ncbi:TPA: hypothetical protein ACGOWV_000931 [Streptococcus suis]
MRRFNIVILVALVSSLLLIGCRQLSLNSFDSRGRVIQDLRKLGQVSKSKKTEFSFQIDGNNRKVVFDYTLEPATISFGTETEAALFYPDSFELLGELDVLDIGQTRYYLNKTALGYSTLNWTRIGQMEEAGLRFIEGIPLQQFQTGEDGIIFTPKTLKEFAVMNEVLAGNLKYSLDQSIEDFLASQHFTRIYFIIGENYFKRVIEKEDGEKEEILLTKTETQ